MRYGSGFRWNAVWVLIVVNAFIFLLASILPELVYFFGLQPASFAEEPWTLVTAMFMHASIWHLLANMLTLYFFGTFLANLVGERRFLVVYFGGGLAGNLAFMALTLLVHLPARFGTPFSVVVGASGALFALGGALAVMRPNVRVFVIPIPAPIPLWIAVIGGFFVLSFVGGVAWQAHLGGLLFGLLAGLFLRSRERGRNWTY